ncbi:Hsp20/alpha crystallin family protein [[Clostridium] polysaccharolyticum]|jgi:HSP20 family molecular chaperone IbpA|uniref:Molecular chaperone IbpA, HSP20 family n=1 Tax=[Clostridium] polysaccharolyticum TaxID=29364 RepID=A0A1I0AEV0_9FIRM|nr:Hsp20/alpha crystallin family protein [[Clostridium] polysaccharolyticum]SES92349.1 Molecular chaperone IbpA, HSP20 family [[Clostridium] polysaccharolyticum]
MMPELKRSGFTKSNLLRAGFPFQDMLSMTKHYIMRSDLKETDSMYLLDVDLPGFQKEDIKACIKDGYLIIEASHKEESYDGSAKGIVKKYIRKERYEGTYRRTFYVGSSLRQEDVKATCRHGVLHLHIPKKTSEQMKPDVITIS